ncbi:hypothetical protein R3P38DRAFT_3201623 [Favolaschia claudopus]|uniref:Uncharacterized protein n=1 Tax=Favolaschia claudopus TaxID=2862362 RepID=A0AAW0AWW9_9AGAR
MHPLYRQALHNGDAPAPHEYCFSGYLELWGWEKTGVPPEYSARGKNWGPLGPPWAGPPVDAAMPLWAHLSELREQGLPLPAYVHDSELVSKGPPKSQWWPSSIVKLYDESHDERYYYKYIFRRRYPFLPRPHPDRAAETADFQRKQRLLFGCLAASHGIFLMRTRQQEGITAAAAARKYALIGLPKQEAATYRFDICRDDFLAAWLGAEAEEVGKWGTVHDPRLRAPSPASSDDDDTGGWGQHVSSWGGGWGTGNGVVVGGGWGNNIGWNNGGWGAGWGNNATGGADDECSLPDWP